MQTRPRLTQRPHGALRSHLTLTARQSVQAPDSRDKVLSCAMHQGHRTTLATLTLGMHGRTGWATDLSPDARRDARMCMHT